MQPMYFGDSGRPIFGLYQAPTTRVTVQAGVVLCHPMSPEYFPAYPAFKHLASACARAGLHVLRFDFHGTGDSAGASGDGYLAQWQADLASAIEELKDIACLSRVSLVGLRLGASIAALVASERDDIARVALWEPIVDGRPYLEELIALEESFVRRLLPRPKQALRDAAHFEVMGVPISPRLRSDLAALDLLTLRKRPAEQLLLVARSEVPEHASFGDYLRRLGGQLQESRTDGPKVWVREGELNGALFSPDTPREIVTWIC